MTDGFIADVRSYNPVDNTWMVEPRIVEFDGTDHPLIKVNAVQGISPNVGDVVMVVTIRNNLDDKKINRFYEASETNGRIVGVAKPVTQYVFEGNYKFEGNLIIDGDLTVEDDLRVKGDLEVDGDAFIDDDLSVGGDLEVDGETATGSLTVNGIDWLLHTHPNNAPAPGPTGPGTQ
jgi:hypothetical protein